MENSPKSLYLIVTPLNHIAYYTGRPMPLLQLILQQVSVYFHTSFIDYVFKNFYFYELIEVHIYL